MQASVTAIESRDPTTSGHSFRVADFTVALATAVDRADHGTFRGVRFSHDEMKEIRYASLLHDFGKVGVREEVLVKAKKLPVGQLDMIRQRGEIIRRGLELRHARRKTDWLLQHGREGFARSQRAVGRRAGRGARRPRPAPQGGRGRERAHRDAGRRLRLDPRPGRSRLSGSPGRLPDPDHAGGGPHPGHPAGQPDPGRVRADPVPRRAHVPVPQADPVDEGAPPRPRDRALPPREAERRRLPGRLARPGHPGADAHDDHLRHLRRADLARPPVQARGAGRARARHPRPGAQVRRAGRRPAPDLHRGPALGAARTAPESPPGVSSPAARPARPTTPRPAAWRPRRADRRPTSSPPVERSARKKGGVPRAPARASRSTPGAARRDASRTSNRGA